MRHDASRFPSGCMNTEDPAQEFAEETFVSPFVAARPLQRYLGRHNRQALLLAFFSLVATVVLWGLVYLFVFWFCLFTITVVKSFSIETLSQVSSQAGLLGPWFPAWFALGAVVYLVTAAILRKRVRTDKVREARYYLVWVMLELFMAVPNVTFSVWGNLRAITKLGKVEVAEAWRLLQRMNQEEGRLSLSSLRLEIEDEKMLCRVVFALQIIGLVGMRENSQGWFLYLQGQDVRNLLSGAVA